VVPEDRYSILCLCETSQPVKNLTRGRYESVARCYHCGSETALHEAGVPTCLNCIEKLEPRIRSVHTQLFQELLEATSEFQTALANHDRITSNIASGSFRPDGAASVSTSHELSLAKENVIRAHARLTSFLDRGIVPENLK